MSEETTRSRRRALQTLGSVVVAGLAGCGSSGSAEPEGQSTGTGTPTGTPTPEPTATENDTATAERETVHDNASHEHEDAEAPESVEFVENPEEVHPTLVEATSAGSDEVLIGLRLEDSSLPFTTEVYHAPADAEVHATRIYDTQDLSRVDLVPESERTLDTVDTDREDIHYGTTTVGEPLTVTLVARHDGDAFEWSSWDRTGHPYDGHDEENLALEVACYCGGMVYTAPSGGTWARVIQVTPTERVDSGSTILLNWTSSRL
jgi:hypothetical protein